MLGRKRAMCDPNMGTPSNVTSCTTATTGAWVYTYNTAGDLLTQRDAKNQTLTFTYDELGRPKTKVQGTTTRATWNYDDPAVINSKGRLTRVVDLPATQNTITNFAYDVLGRVTQSQRVLLGVTHTMSQSYDALNRITSETFPDSDIVTYSYNDAGWLNSVPGYINGVTYNARGQKTQLTYANNLTTTWTYDANTFRVTNRTTSNNQQNLTYAYDNNSNITSITDSLFTASRTFTYDDLNRLITASGTFGVNQSQTSCTYAYNAIGNITNKCGAVFSYGDAMHPSAVTFNPATNKSYTYDANGNMLTRGNQTLTWDIDNRVTSVSIAGGGTTFMEYDYTGMRVKKNAPTGITLFPFKGYEIAPSGLITKFIKIGTESVAAKKGSEAFFYHNDHLGSVHVVTDRFGARMQLNEYDPWGTVSRSEGATPGSQPWLDPTHRFTGQELDPETGFYYYGGRYYDQEISRFISPDPFVQAPENPQNLNRYSYVLNNPQNFIDPTGYDHADGGGTYSIPLYGWVKFFSDWFSDLFGGDDKKEHRIKRRKQVAAPTPHHEVTVKNGGPENERLQNVRVYDSQPPPWSEDPNRRTGNARTDYPTEGPVLKTAPRPPHDTTIISICSAGSDSCTDIGLLDIFGIGAIGRLGINQAAKAAANSKALSKALTLTPHALERMAERGVTEKMIDAAIKKGQKFWDPVNRSVVHVLEEGLASGNTLMVAQDPVSGAIKTVITGTSKGVIRPRFVPLP